MTLLVIVGDASMQTTAPPLLPGLSAPVIVNPLTTAAAVSEWSKTMQFAFSAASRMVVPAPA